MSRSIATILTTECGDDADRENCRSHPRFIFLVLVCLFFASPARAEEWRALVWRGEKAWASKSGDWTALVSEKRGRLLFFGQWERGANLLYAPFPAGRAPSLGGHRFWLGPQSEWKVFWPPPANWESGPSVVSASEGTLKVSLPRTDRDYPRMTRTYHWDGSRLVCRVIWGPGGMRHHQAIQTFQLPTSAVVRSKVSPEPSLPKGFAIFQTGALNGLLTEFSIPGAVRVKGGLLTAVRDGREWKLALPPQPLICRIGDAELTLSRGRSIGRVARLPERGLLTQVYLGADKDLCPFVEIEQLSAVLQPVWPWSASFEVCLEARFLKAQDPF